jgi:hypothetical protein
VLNAATSPQGINNAFSFNVNDGQSGGQAFVTLTTSSQSYTFSAYLKGSVNGQKVRLFSDINGTIQDFTLTTEWVRYTKTFTGSVGAQSFYLLNGSYFSPAQNDLYFGYGMQLEVGAYATSLIPTQGSTVTRNADVISKTGISSLIGQTEGTIFADCFINTSDATSTGICGISGTGLNFIYLFKQGGNILRANVFTTSQQTSLTYTFPNSNFYKIAFKYKQNAFSLFINGVKISSSNSGNVPLCSAFNFYDISLGLNPNGVYKSASLFKTALTDEECIQLTTI